LYDTETSRTITQFDLARLLEVGHDVQVIDSESGEDITLTVLGRVMIAESSRWQDIKDSTEVVRQVIIAGGEHSMSILKNTILAGIGVINVTKAKAEKIIDDLIKKGELDKSDRKKAVMELLEKAEKSTESFRSKVWKEAEKAQKSVKKVTAGLNWATQEDLKKLERKVNRLAKKVKELHPD
jgi:poly(hydroxyalkanoate) granule-associated protein